ncbi:cysteine-rich venom protein TEL1-like isoform X2 [Anneissia japonica]|uniref:cysteine-rich venom protein TEL1-like isoform X2 n=1 Tax=Anneissia japonica TaxID=1529436 RepID=UPI0014259C35|nr:cysteine-rich venom protein TEL1-like isoform X2 [Anneissia japonica]
MFCILMFFLVALLSQEIHCLTASEKTLIVSTHNSYRKNVSPPAADMTELEWSDEVAGVAEAWSAKCIMSHNPNRNGYGENMAMSTKPYRGGELRKAVKAWYREFKNYNYTTGGCEGVCGHYTQVVDTRSVKIGCATNRAPCSGPSFPYRLFCNYSPAGNFNNQKPYQTGKKCTRCPDNAKYCNNGFCECKRKCANGGELQRDSCTCICNDKKGFYGPFCADSCINNAPCTPYLTWDKSVVCAKQYFIDQCPLKCNSDCKNAKSS